MNKLTNIKHYRKEYVRALYGKLGKDSGLKPGVMWPRKEELLYLKQYEEAFCPSLKDLIAENESIKQLSLRKRQAREQEVLKNLERLPKEFEAFFARIKEKEREKEKWLKERETMIEEVREILGFRAKPTDERFQQALAQKEEEDLKARKKEARKQRENAGLDELLGSSKTPQEN